MTSARSKQTIRRVAIRILLGCALAMALFLLADHGVFRDWLQPAFYVPYMAAAVATANPHSPDTWVIATFLIVQCCVVVAALGWVVDRVRSTRNV